MKIDENELDRKISKAAKWSTLTEVLAKLITPIITIILARLIAPEAFGLVATITMIVSFVDMFTDAGFQKYLIQHEFKNDDHKYKSTTVAFWTNLSFSLIIWGVIATLSEQIAFLVGNKGMGSVITIACIQLPLTAFSSIQMALYKRDFDFKSLFLIRIITVFVPFIVTIPLAIMGYSYWSLIIGTICGHLFNAIVMTVKSKWKPNLFYDFAILKEMLSFSVWSLVEAVFIWLTTWVDIFLIGIYLDTYYLGLYKTAITMVNSLMALVTGSIIPVLFAALSRLQSDEKAFKEMFYKVQRLVAYIAFPIGVGVYLYSDIATGILLGNHWEEASDIIGIWALMASIMIVFSNFNSEVYRSTGKPKLSSLAQFVQLIFLVPTCLISIKYGFWFFVYARTLIRLQHALFGSILMHYIMGFPIKNVIKNSVNPIKFTLIMCGFALILKQFSDSTLWGLFSICCCGLVYITCIFFFGKKDINILKQFLKR